MTDTRAPTPIGVAAAEAVATDDLRLLPQEPLPDRLLQAERRHQEYVERAEEVTGRRPSKPILLRDALAGLDEDAMALAIDPLSRRQRRSQREKEAFARHLREHQTLAESILWERLELMATDGIVWEPQVILHGWIVDFYCADARLIIEVDGPVHNAPWQYQRDRQRDEVFQRNGYRLIRVTNESVTRHLDATVNRIVNRLAVDHGG